MDTASFAHALIMATAGQAYALTMDVVGFIHALTMEIVGQLACILTMDSSSWDSGLARRQAPATSQVTYDNNHDGCVIYHNVDSVFAHFTSLSDGGIESLWKDFNTKNISNSINEGHIRIVLEQVNNLPYTRNVRCDFRDPRLLSNMNVNKIFDGEFKRNQKTTIANIQRNTANTNSWCRKFICSTCIDVTYNNGSFWQLSYGKVEPSKNVLIDSSSKVAIKLLSV